MSGDNQNEDLQDLSANDADELKAFVAKRNWFEAKLKALEENQPIYPFVQFPEATGVAEEHTTTQKPHEIRHELPTESQLEIWRAERDAIEEEVISFDGGDLERMKRKTRAVTTVPLTPPSTELVEVTLDLIVIVDRLLTLLRHRSDLLDLTTVRHQWDRFRIGCEEEMDSIDAHLATVHRSTLAWMSGDDSISVAAKGAREVLGDEDTSKPQASSLEPTTPVPRTRRYGVSSSPAASVQGATPSRSSLHMPLLRSKITNLQIRHSTLASTTIPRAAGSLDRMIDIAGPLAGLGGVNGPVAKEVETAAVPEQLLDMQDEIELRSRRLAQDIHQCRQAIEQSAEAEIETARSIRVRDAAADLLSLLGEDAGRDLDHARARWHDLSGQLPESVQWTALAVENGLQYPDNVIASIVGRSETARREAVKMLKRCERHLVWQERVYEQKGVVRTCLDELQTRATELTALLVRADELADDDTPFSLVTANESTVSLISDIDAWIQRQASVDATQPNLSTRITVARMKYRAILGQVPPDIDMAVSARHSDLLSSIDDECEASERNSVLLTTAQARLALDEKLRKLVTELKSSETGARTDLDDFSIALRERIDAVLWTDDTDVQPQARHGDLDAKLKDLESNTTIEELQSEIAQLGLAHHRYSPMAQVCYNATRLLRSKLDQARQLRDLLDKATAQTAAVISVRSEATALKEKIELATETRPETAEEVKQWLSTLANRIPYLSTASDARTTEEPLHPQQSSLQAAFALQITPPTSPSLPGLYVDNLAAVDRLVRDEVNRQAAKVSGALAHVTSQETVAPSLSGPHHSGDIVSAPAPQSPPPVTTKAISEMSSRSGVKPHSRQAGYGVLGRSTAARDSSTTASPRAGPQKSRTASKPTSDTSARRSTSSATPRVSSTSSASSTSVARALARSTTPSRSISLGQSSAITPGLRQLALSTRSDRQSSMSWRRPALPTTPTRKSRKYVPDSRNQLDVAVGDIVNDFKTHVPVVPIGASVKDEYKDSTGSYWIGAEGRAKLCYCRILRSKMVMVRVGGGWVELSKFLEDHFSGSDLTPDAPSPLSGAPSDPSHTFTEISMKTPVRTRVASASAVLQGSPIRGSRDEIDIDALPTPLRFIKRASDSPDARKKEKANLRVGRRSILGKERE